MMRNSPERLGDEADKGKVNGAHQQVAFTDETTWNKLDRITTDVAIAMNGRVKPSELANMRTHVIGHANSQDPKMRVLESD